MKIYRKKDALNVSKSEMLNVFYYLFNEYEIHYNRQKPNSEQIWHHHNEIWETIYIIDGELTVKWKEEKAEKSEILKSGDLVEVGNTPHTFANNSNQITKFMVFKQILSGKNKRGILRKDKILD